MIALRCPGAGLTSNRHARHFDYPVGRAIDVVVIGRAGLDLYPEPDGVEIAAAAAFSSDAGGSGGNIAAAVSRAGGSAALVSALSADAVGDWVRARLRAAEVDIRHVVDCAEPGRTSLALAEVRAADCAVVIYRNAAADWHWRYDDAVRDSLRRAANLVVTGTGLVAPRSRDQTIAAMRDARRERCVVWLDLDYRRCNGVDLDATRRAYRQAAAHADVLVGNEAEFGVLDDDLTTRIGQARAQGQVVILKRGTAGARLYAGDAILDCGVFDVKVKKPYGAGDAFLGNVVTAYQRSGHWRQALVVGSAAGAWVVARRGCVSAMPTPDEIQSLRDRQAPRPAPVWS